MSLVICSMLDNHDIPGPLFDERLQSELTPSVRKSRHLVGTVQATDCANDSRKHMSSLSNPSRRRRIWRCTPRHLCGLRG